MQALELRFEEHMICEVKFKKIKAHIIWMDGYMPWRVNRLCFNLNEQTFSSY